MLHTANHRSGFKYVFDSEDVNSWFTFDDEVSVRDRWWRIKPNDVVLDIGAACGSYALPALAQGAARVIAWSPEEKHSRFLHLSLAANQWEARCQVLATGLWSKSGFLIAPDGPHPSELYPYREEAEEAVMRIKLAGRHTSPPFAVSTLDQAATTLDLARLDWVKIDAEGAEPEIIMGGQELIRRFKPAIFLENHLFKKPGVKDECAGILLAWGYAEIETLPWPGGQISHSLYRVL